jgi:RNA polymerase sigma-70 factor, ECF subfamily
VQTAVASVEIEPEALARLAERARDGDAAAFRGLVDAATPRLYRLALRLLGDRDEADDVVQETFTRAWDRRGELRDPAAALGWLAGIARNAARDRQRWWRRWRGPGAVGSSGGEALAELVGPDAPADQKLAAAELGERLARAMARLSDEHRAVLLLREVDGLSMGEIAELCGVPVGTVESRLHRARAALARRVGRLAREWAGPEGGEA